MNLIVNFECLGKLDKFDPMSRFAYLCDNEFVNNILLCNRILLALKAVDEVVSKDLNGACYLYLQDDLSVKWLLENALDCQLEINEFESSLYCIDFSKLIYRFTCAKKFRVKDSSINQLRINSWGRVFIEQNGNKEFEEEYSELKSIFEIYYNSNKETYLKLESLVSTAVTEEVAEEIQKLNQGLRVKILS